MNSNENQIESANAAMADTAANGFDSNSSGIEEGASGDRERERLPEAMLEAIEKGRGHGVPTEAEFTQDATNNDARIMDRGESLEGEVMERVKLSNGSTGYLIKSGDENVLVPEVDGERRDVGDEIECEREKDGTYRQNEMDNDYGR